MLRVDRDSLPSGQFRKIDPMRPPPKSQVHPVVDEPFFLQPLADSSLNHQIDSPLLQHTRAHPLLHVLLAAILNNDGFDSPQTQKMREPPSGRTRADISHLRAQFFHATILRPRAVTWSAKM